MQVELNETGRRIVIKGLCKTIHDLEEQQKTVQFQFQEAQIELDLYETRTALGAFIGRENVTQVVSNYYDMIADQNSYLKNNK